MVTRGDSPEGAARRGRSVGGLEVELGVDEGHVGDAPVLVAHHLVLQVLQLRLLQTVRTASHTCRSPEHSLTTHLSVVVLEELLVCDPLLLVLGVDGRALLPEASRQLLGRDLAAGCPGVLRGHLHLLAQPRHLRRQRRVARLQLLLLRRALAHHGGLFAPKQAKFFDSHYLILKLTADAIHSEFM